MLIFFQFCFKIYNCNKLKTAKTPRPAGAVRGNMPEGIEAKRDIYQLLKTGDFETAETRAAELLGDPGLARDAEMIMKAAKFWQNRRPLFIYSEDNGEKLYNEWDVFLGFCRENRVESKKTVLSVKDYVFRTIVDHLIETYQTSPMTSLETLILLGQAFYEVGMAEKAVETLEYALSQSRGNEDVRVYIILANLYAGLNDNALAMVMLNEAFFRFPQFVDLDALDYPPLSRVREMIKKDGFNDNELLEWMPVYGWLYDALTVKRRLEYQEYSDLKEKILDYEKSLKVDKKVVNIIIPRLVNFYLWAFDYSYHQMGAMGMCRNLKRRVDELLAEIPLHEGLTAQVKQKLRERAEAVFLKMLQKPPAGPAEQAGVTGNAKAN